MEKAQKLVPRLKFVQFQYHRYRTNGFESMNSNIAGEFPEVKVVRHDVPHGPGGARSSGIAASDGDGVLFLHDDDLIHGNHVKELYGPPANDADKSDVAAIRSLDEA